MGLYKKALEAAGSAVENPYNTFNSLVKYYSTRPDKGMTAESTAQQHLTIELARLIARLRKEAKPGNFTAWVHDRGKNKPLLPYMKTYAKAFRDSYQDPDDTGEHRTLYFGDDGKLLLTHFLDSGAIRPGDQEIGRGMAAAQTKGGTPAVLRYLRKRLNDSANISLGMGPGGK